MSLKDPELKKQYQKAYYEKNKERLAKQFQEYHQSNKQDILERHKEYRGNNKDKIREINKIYQNRKEKEDVGYKLGRRLRNRLYYALKNNQKTGSAIKDLGCSVEELKAYLEKQFRPGMTWDNWGRPEGCWHIDHIRPLCSFNLEDREQFLEAVNYKNLQPLWAKENIVKGGRGV